MKVSCFLICLSVVFSSLTSRSDAHSEESDLISHVAVVENPTINTPLGNINHLSDFTITFSLNQVQSTTKKQNIKLDLHPNHDILSQDAQVTYLDAYGQIKSSEALDRAAHKVFKGTSWLQQGNGQWEKAGWTRIYIHQDGERPLMEGAFSIDQDHHNIKLRSSYLQTKRDMDVHPEAREDDYMIIYRDFNIPSSTPKRDDTSSSCAADEVSFNMGLDPFSLSRMKNRQSGTIGTGDLRATIGDTSGCPTEARVALVGIATDCTYTASFSSVEAVRQNLITIVNTASDLYERTFQISIGLRNLTISDAECPSTPPESALWNRPCDGTDIEERLQLFSAWRGDIGDDNAYWTLMSTCASGSSVGLAWLGQLCVSGQRGYGSQSVSGANVVVRTSSEWQVFAHEAGHTFGAVHDCDSTACASSSSSQRCCPISTTSCNAEGQYLMSPISNRGLTEFSPCSIGNICSVLGRNSVSSTCLSENRNLTTINGSQCGNGIVEAGEDCDCGGEDSCGDNSCCDPSTCRFINNAVCDDANESCCSSCQFSSSSTICRVSSGICDLEETCTGSSGSCPTDSYLPDGQSCGNETELACASGQCTSRDLQCQIVEDPTTEGNYTGACDSTTCRLTCSTSTSDRYCASMNQIFLDGTPCGSGNSCSNGLCSSSSDDEDDVTGNGDGNNSSSWFDNNRSLVIGLAAGIGGLFVLLILGCCLGSCRRRRRQRKIASAPQSQPPMSGPWNNHPPPAYPGQARVPMVRYA